MITATIILCLIVLNGVFVMAEFALLCVPRLALEKMGYEGHSLASRMSRLLKTPTLLDRYIATAQLGVTFASLGLGVFGEHALAEAIYNWLANYDAASWLVAHGAAGILSVAALTYLHIVLGEMVPKALSLQYAIRFCLLLAIPMQVMQVCLYPLVFAMNAVGNALLRVFGVDRNTSTSYYHSAEEIQYIIEESHENGVLPQESGRIIDSLFDLDDLYVHQVMTPRVRINALPVGATHEQIREIVSKTRRTRYPVYQNDLDHITGLVHARDLCAIMLRQDTLTQEYIHPILKVPKTVKFDYVIAIMQKNNARMAIILDEYGGTSGMITLTDVFAEVMGWDRNRIKVLTDDIAPTQQGFACDVAGLARIEELAEVFETDLQYDEIDSVGGLILNLLQAPARQHDQVEYLGLIFNVTQVTNGGIVRCTVTRSQTVVQESELGEVENIA